MNISKFESFGNKNQEFLNWLEKNPEILEMIDIINESLSILSDDIDFDIHYNFNHIVFYKPKDKYGKYVPVFSESDEELEDDDDGLNLSKIQKKLSGFSKIEFKRVIGVSDISKHTEELKYLKSICNADNISIEETYGEGGNKDFQLRFSKELDLSYFKKNDPFNKIPKNLIEDFEEFANSIDLIKSEDRQKLVDLFDKWKSSNSPN